MANRNKDVIGISFDATAGLKALENNIMDAMQDISDEMQGKLNEAFEKAGKNPKLKKQLTGVYQGLFDELLESAGDLDETNKAIDRFTGKIEYLNDVINKTRSKNGQKNSGLLDGLAIGDINKVLEGYEEVIEARKKLAEYDSIEFRDNKRSETTIKSLKELEQTYGKVGKEKDKYEGKVNEYLKNVGIETSVISKEIKEYSSLITLFEKINSTKVEVGSEDAIKKSQALLYVMQQITDLEKGNTLFSNFRINETDIKALQSSITDLSQGVNGAISKFVSTISKELNAEISNTLIKAVEVAEKASQHQFISAQKSQAKIGGGKGNGSGDGSGTGGGNADDATTPPDFNDKPDSLDVWAKSAENLKEQFSDVIKYGKDAESTFTRLNELWKKYDKGLPISQDEITEMWGLMKRLDELELNGLSNGFKLNKNQIDEFKEWEDDDLYSKLFDRIQIMTEAQLAEIEKLKVAQKEVGSEGIVSSKANNSMQETNNDITELVQRVEVLETSLSDMQSQLNSLNGEAFEQMKNDIAGVQQELSETIEKIKELKANTGSSLENELEKMGLTVETATEYGNSIMNILAVDDKTGTLAEWDNIVETVTAYHEQVKETNAYLQKGNDLIEERAILLKNGKQVGEEYVMSDATGKVDIGNGIKKYDADSVLHTHAFDEKVNNLRFSDADIQELVDGTVKKALLLCGDEIATLDMANIAQSDFEPLKNDILGAYKAVFARFGAEVKDGKLVGIDVLPPEVQNQATDIVNNLIRNIMQNYGGGLYFDKIDGDGFVENEDVRLPKIESPEMAIVQQYLDAVASDKPIENVIALQKQFGVLKTELKEVQKQVEETTTALSQSDKSTVLSGNQSSVLSSPTQEFDNEVQKDLVYLENYKNTIEEINKLKLEPQTDDTKKKLEELQKLADYFFGSISVTRSQWNNDGANFVDDYGSRRADLSLKGYNESANEIYKIGREIQNSSGKLNIHNLTSEFSGISEEISRIESKSEGLRNALTKDLTESKTYVSKLRAAFVNMADTQEELKTETSPKWIESYNNDIDKWLTKFPELIQFKDKFLSYDSAIKFVKTDEWMEFVATLPQAKTYLESIGYEFKEIAQVESPNQTEVLSGTESATTIEETRQSVENLGKEFITLTGLIHASKVEFDKFDDSKLGSDVSNNFGKGAYFAFDKSSQFVSSGDHGNVVSEWIAKNIRDVFDVTGKNKPGLSEDEALQILKSYLPNFGERSKEYIDDWIKDLTDSGMSAVNAIKELANIAGNVDLRDIFKSIGYDAIQDNEKINIFDVSNLEKVITISKEEQAEIEKTKQSYAEQIQILKEKYKLAGNVSEEVVAQKSVEEAGRLASELDAEIKPIQDLYDEIKSLTNAESLYKAELLEVEDILNRMYSDSSTYLMRSFEEPNQTPLSSSDKNQVKETVHEQEALEQQSIETTTAINEQANAIDNLRKMYNDLHDAFDALPKQKTEQPEEYVYDYSKAKDYVDFAYDGEDSFGNLDFDSWDKEYTERLESIRKAIQLTVNKVKEMQNAVDKHAGHLGDEIYDERDIENAKQGLMGLFEMYAANDGDLDSLDVKLTKPFKSLIETVKESMVVNNAQKEQYKTETKEIIANNSQQIQSYEELYKATVKAFDAYKSSDSKYKEPKLPWITTGFHFDEYAAYDEDNSFEEICKYLGIEIPQATEKAKQSIKEVVNVPLLSNENIEANNREIISNEEVIASEKKKLKYKIAARTEIPRLAKQESSAVVEANKDIIESNEEIISSEEEVKKSRVHNSDIIHKPNNITDDVQVLPNSKQDKLVAQMANAHESSILRQQKETKKLEETQSKAVNSNIEREQKEIALIDEKVAKTIQARQEEEKRLELAQNKAINKALEKDYVDEQKLTEQMAKGREKSEIKTSQNDKKDEINQAKAINKAIEKDYQDREKLLEQMARAREKSEEKSRQNNFKNELNQNKAINKSLEDAYKEKEKQKNNFYSKNANAIDLEIRKREEEGKLFAKQLKEQMELQVKQEHAKNKKSNSSYDKELKLEQEINKLKIKNISASKEEVAANNVLIERKQKLIQNEIEYRNANNLVNSDKEAELINRKNTLTQELAIAQEAYNKKLSESTKYSNDVVEYMRLLKEEVLKANLNLGEQVDVSQGKSDGSATITFVKDLGTESEITKMKVSDMLDVIEQLQNGTFDISKYKLDVSVVNNNELQNSVKKALSDQLSSWKEMESIRAKIAKSTNDVEIKNLKKAQDIEKQKYIEASKILESNVDLYDNEKRLLDLEEIRAKTNADIAKYQAQQKEAFESSSKSAISSADKTLSTNNNNLTKLAKRDEQTPEYTEAVNKYRSAIENLQEKVDYFNANGIKTQDDITELNRLEKEVKEASEAIAIMSIDEMGTPGVSSSTVFLKIEQLRNRFKGMSKDMRNELDVMEKEFRDMGNALNVSNAIRDLKNFEAQLLKTKTATHTLWSAIKDKAFYGLAAQIGTYFGFNDVIQGLRQAYNYVAEIDKQMIELEKVSDMSSSRLAESFEHATIAAKDLGSTVSDVISATADWSRLGYDADAAEQLAEVATIYKNVGDGIDISTANNSLISTLQGFQMEASQAMEIVDSFNEVANRMPIDSAGIGEALQRSAASFNAANTSLSESISLITATNAVIQDPTSVGTMWKTVSARIRGAKTELEEMGEDTEGMVESTSKLRDLVKGMTGFDIMEDEDTFKSIYDIMVGIGEEWENLSDIDQAALLEALAGKRAGNALAAALQNVDMIKEAYQIAENSSGSAMREQEKWEQGLEARTNKLKASLETLSTTFLDSDFLGVLIDAGRGLIDILTVIIDKLGVIPTLLGAGGGIFAGFKAFKGEGK